MALAHSGFAALNDYVGRPDIFGRPLAVTKANVSDALAAAAVLVMGEGNEQTPLAVITGLPFATFQDRDPTDQELAGLRIPLEDDLYAPLLTKTAWQEGGQAARHHSRGRHAARSTHHDGDGDDTRMTRVRFQATVAVHLLLIRGEEVLLSRRHHTGYEDGNYSVIAGHLDGNETASQAMVREAAEEAGIVVAPADLRFVHVMHRKEAAEADERIDLFFAATRWEGEPTICEPEKCSELRWVALAALPTNMVPYVRAALEHYRQNQAYDEFWPAAAAPVSQ